MCSWTVGVLGRDLKEVLVLWTCRHAENSLILFLFQFYKYFFFCVVQNPLVVKEFFGLPELKQFKLGLDLYLIQCQAGVYCHRA